MKRALCLGALAMLCLGASAWGGGMGLPCCNHGIHCIVPPPPACPDCREPCARRLCLTCCGSDHAHQLVERLCTCDDCCGRIKAARKLGCRLHADFCHDPQVLSALVHALHCDPCWEVRREAAWSIAMQGARTDYGVLALYLASKIDPHFLVRDRANDALDILIVCRRNCFKELFADADAWMKKNLKGKYKPADCHRLDELYMSRGIVGSAPCQ